MKRAANSAGEGCVVILADAVVIEPHDELDARVLLAGALKRAQLGEVHDLERLDTGRADGGEIGVGEHRIVAGMQSDAHVLSRVQGAQAMKRMNTWLLSSRPRRVSSRRSPSSTSRPSSTRAAICGAKTLEWPAVLRGESGGGDSLI